MREPSTTSSNCQVVCFLYILKMAAVMETADLATENLTLSPMLVFLELKVFWYSRDYCLAFCFSADQYFTSKKLSKVLGLYLIFLK